MDGGVEGGSWGVVGSFHDVKRGSKGGERGLRGGEGGKQGFCREERGSVSEEGCCGGELEGLGGGEGKNVASVGWKGGSVSGG